MMVEDAKTSPRRSSRLETKQDTPKSTISDDGWSKESSALRLELSPSSVTPGKDFAPKPFETPSSHPHCVLITRGNILHSGLDSEGESPKSPTFTPPRSELRKCPVYSPKYSPSSSPRWHHRFRKALAEVAWEESNRTRFETGSFYGSRVARKSSFELKLAASQLGLPGRSSSLPLTNHTNVKEDKVKKSSTAARKSSVKHRSPASHSSKNIRLKSVKNLVPSKKSVHGNIPAATGSNSQRKNDSTSVSANTTPSPPRIKRKFFSRSAALRSPSKRPRSSFKMGNHKVSVEASKYSPKRKCVSPNKSSSPGTPQIRTSPRRHKLSPQSNSSSSPQEESRLAPQNLEFTNDFETSFNKTTDELLGVGLFEDPPSCDEMKSEQVPIGNRGNKQENKSKPGSRSMSTSEPTNTNRKQMYPIFSRTRSSSTPSPASITLGKAPKRLFNKITTPRRSRLRSSKKDTLEQLVIDVGQKEVAATQCETCGMYYTPCDEDDNITHTRYHNILQTNLKFPGWKREKVVGEFHDGRIIQILPTDLRYAQQKVQEVRDVVDEELGFAESDSHKGKKYQAFLFIAEKKVVGCLLAETISMAHRIIDDPSKSSLCCEETSEKALCGISRIWTLKTYRKQKIASRLVDILRSHYIFGYVMSKDEIAFTVPTQDGQHFASHYTGTKAFLVYK